MVKFMLVSLGAVGLPPTGVLFHVIEGPRHGALHYSPPGPDRDTFTYQNIIQAGGPTDIYMCVGGSAVCIKQKRQKRKGIALLLFYTERCLYPGLLKGQRR
jgi:hypothetical protein